MHSSQLKWWFSTHAVASTAIAAAVDFSALCIRQHVHPSANYLLPVAVLSRRFQLQPTGLPPKLALLSSCILPHSPPCEISTGQQQAASVGQIMPRGVLEIAGDLPIRCATLEHI